MIGNGKMIHVCGESGMNFVMWLRKRLEEQGIMAYVVDCSAGRMLYTSFSRVKRRVPGVLLSEDWELRFKNKGVVIMYHEEQDRFTDNYPGLYLIFTTGYRLDYTRELIYKLTDGRLVLFDYTLIPQLNGGSYVYMCALKDSRAIGERFIPSYSLDKVSGPYDTELLEIMAKYVLTFINY